MAWKISGRYMETCNCDYVCPCPLTGLAETTHGTCIFAMAYRVDEGQFNGVSLSGAKFLAIGRTPGNMGEGNWEVGVIVDDATTTEQREAIGAIAGVQQGEDGHPVPQPRRALGASGYVGGRLLKALEDAGHRVRCLAPT